MTELCHISVILELPHACRDGGHDSACQLDILLKEPQPLHALSDRRCEGLDLGDLLKQLPPLPASLKIIALGRVSIFHSPFDDVRHI